MPHPRPAVPPRRSKAAPPAARAGGHRARARAWRRASARAWPAPTALPSGLASLGAVDRCNTVTGMRTLDALDDAGRSGIATDLYELTMGAAYFDAGLAPTIGTFELFVRQLPENRSFLVAAGLAQAVEFLLAMRFDGRSIDYLRGLPVFSRAPAGFWEYLAGLRFTGDVHAIPEGTVV